MEDRARGLTKEATMTEEEDFRPPWFPCPTCHRRAADIVATCHACDGLGLALPKNWIESAWSIVFMTVVKDDAPEATARLVLDGIYPDGGYTILPPAHPAFDDVIALARKNMPPDASLVDRERAVWLVPGRDVRLHMTVVLLQHLPEKKESPRCAS